MRTITPIPPVTPIRPMRLLERLNHGHRGLQISEAISAGNSDRADILRESVARHLQRILNTRRGYTPIDQDLGLPDSLGCETASAARLATHIAQLLGRSESRVRALRVTPIQGAHATAPVRFAIEGRLGATTTAPLLRVTARLTAIGRVSLENLSVDAP